MVLVCCRGFAYPCRSSSSAIITVGGTGKTPLTIALVEALRARGFNPGVISRGYGGSARAPLAVDAHSDPARCRRRAVPDCARHRRADRGVQQPGSRSRLVAEVISN